MSLTEQIQTDANAAAKARDKERLSALRMVLDALTKEAKEARADLDEQGEIAVLKRERKRRVEAAEAFEKGGRDEAADKEQAEVDADRRLPARAAVRRRPARDRGGGGRRVRRGVACRTSAR